jgi:hypothetical protein
MTKHIALLLLFTASAFGSLATPAPISSVSCSAGVCTVTTSSAHNVSPGDPGFIILGSSVSADNLAGTAASVVDGTHFTVNSTAMANCSSSCGTAQPAPVFILRSSSASFGSQNVSACMWIFVTNGAPISNGTSGCSAQFSGNTQTEINAAIASGSWIEVQQSVPFAQNANLGTIEQYFQALQFSLQLAQGFQPGGVTGHECDPTGCS